MLTHDLMMLAGVALIALALVLALVSLAQSHAPVNAARALVAGIAALVFAAFWNPQPFAPTDIPEAVMRVVRASGLDHVTDVPGAAGTAPAATPAAPPPAVQQDPAKGPLLPQPPIGN